MTGTPIQTQWRSSKQNFDAIDAFYSSRFYKLVIIDSFCTLIVRSFSYSVCMISVWNDCIVLFDVLELYFKTVTVLESPSPDLFPGNFDCHTNSIYYCYYYFLSLFVCA